MNLRSAVLVVAIMSSSQAQEMGITTALRSNDINEREAAAKRVLADRTSTIASLEAIVDEFATTPDRRGTAKTAIDLLGQLRAEESIPLLIKFLKLEVFYKENKRIIGIDERFPAVGALIKIGIRV